MKFTRVALPLLALCAGMYLIVGGINAKSLADDDDPTEDPIEDPVAPEPTESVALPMYEWGVEAFNWDGSARKDEEMPAFYYEPAEVDNMPAAQPTEPEAPVKPPVDGGRKRLKPVVYFAPTVNMTISVEIKFVAGKLTWMYPKPSRLVDPSTVQWDKIALDVKRAADDPRGESPELSKVAKDQWANFSRDGSTCDLAANGEHERFLFYEGTNTAALEVDVLRDAQGQPLVRNYSSHSVYSVRLKLPAEADSSKVLEYFVASVPAASGETPGEQKLSLVPVDRISRSTAELADEVMRAGLTEKQAAVFDRCWNKDILGGAAGTLSYRRDQGALDEETPITVKSPGRKVQLQSHRIGYVLINKVDISATRMAELDVLAQSVADGDKDAGDKLAKLGMAGIGALRRALVDKGLNLKQRLTVAATLKKIQQELAK